MAELKLKKSIFANLTFSISAWPPGGIFPLWLHLPLLWTLRQKSIIQIFDTSWINKNIKQNIKDVCFWASCTCISGTLKVVPGGSHGYFFEVKVETVKLIGGRWLFAAKSGLNGRVYSNRNSRLGMCLSHLQANKLLFTTQKLWQHSVKMIQCVSELYPWADLVLK